MTRRTTADDIRQGETAHRACAAAAGARRVLHAQHRNGAWALDVVDIDAAPGDGVLDLWEAGLTTAECYRVLRAAAWGMGEAAEGSRKGVAPPT